MINTQPTIDPAAKLELRDVAAALGCDKSSVLRWTRNGYLRCGVQRHNGRKYWLGADILRFWRAG